MATTQITTRVDEEQDRRFREYTRQLGTTPADAMRVFVAAFNHFRGFPFDVRLAAEVEPFASEADAAAFASGHAYRLLDGEVAE